MENRTPKTTRYQPIRSSCISKDSLKKLCDKIQQRLDAAFTIELDSFKSNLEKNGKTFTDDMEKELKEGFVLRLTIHGDGDKEFYGTVSEVFDSPDFPEDVTSFYVDTSNYLKAFSNYYVSNSFEILLDFKRPEIFNLSIQPSEKTKNNSYIKVDGYDPSWVNGLFSELTQFFEKKKTNFKFFHGQAVYDLLVWLVGIPVAFWIIGKVTPTIEQIVSEWSSLTANSLYVFVFLLFIFGFRMIFHYARWIWPPVEYVNPDNKNIKHRIVLSTLTLSVLGAFIYDIIKFIIY